MQELIQKSPQQLSEEAYERVYFNHVGHMNRKERRTALGRQLVAEAKFSALLEKIRVLEEHFERDDS